MPADLHQRARQGFILPNKPGQRPTDSRSSPWPTETPESQTVRIVLDATTANTAIFVHADEREAHVRQVEQFGQSLPEGSCGRRNRQTIAARETRVAARLRAVEQAYRIAIEPTAAFSLRKPTVADRPYEYAPDREIELE